MEKKILDVTCGARTIWFNKNEPHTIYCDKRSETFTSEYRSQKCIEIKPDIQCDFTNLPFPDESFSLVVFDPPHLTGMKDTAWIVKKYGLLDESVDWKELIRGGFMECMRVLKPDGVLVFKWSEIMIDTREVIDAIGTEPLFGHRSGRKMNTHWMCFMKFKEGEQ